MYLDDFNPHSVEPDLFVDRDEDRGWLRERIRRYLDTAPADRGMPLALVGEKGVGKTILVKKVFHELRETHSADTLFLQVDCRRASNRRDVLRDIAQRALEELSSLKGVGVRVPDQLLAAAHVLVTITRFDDMELSEIHEHLTQYKAAVGFAGKALLSNLALNFGISLDRSSKDIKTLTGKVMFDEDRLGRALCDFFRDIRDCQLRVILWIDNLDELHHRYRDQDERDRVRQDAEGILLLTEAPIALVLCMRTYYSGIVREISRRALGRLDHPTLMAIADRRLKGERAEVQALVGSERAQAMLQLLAKEASTPLAFLNWVQFFVEENLLDVSELEAATRRYMEARFAQVPLSAMRKIGEAFPGRDHAVSRQRLIEACDGNEATLAQIQDNQVVLPSDFWNPLEFTLDPELHLLLHGRPR